MKSEMVLCDRAVGQVPRRRAALRQGVATGVILVAQHDEACRTR